MKAGGTYTGPGKVSIGFTMGGSQVGKRAVIEIMCARSHTIIASAELTMEAFAYAVSGSAQMEADIRVWTSAPLGKVHENKTELVDVPPNSYTRYGKGAAAAGRAAFIRKVLKPYEVDGWVGREDDLFNHHNRRPDGRYSVTFHRYVDP
jgi:hypothetical protein